MPTKNETADLLEKAADVIFTQGHCKGQLENDKGEVCAVGALKVAAYGIAYNIYNEVSDGVIFDNSYQALCNKLDPYAITTWNDLPETTAEQVMDTMKEVAKDLRNATSEQV